MIPFRVFWLTVYLGDTKIIINGASFIDNPVAPLVPMTEVEHGVMSTSLFSTSVELDLQNVCPYVRMSQIFVD